MPIIFIATSWAATKGGINALNHDLCVALSKMVSNSFCIVPSASAADLKESSESEVVLLSLDLTGDEFEQHSVYAIKEKFQLSITKEHIWVGHDVKTGPLALRCSAEMGGISVVFHHMDYANYYSHVDLSQISVKIDEQKSILRKANIVFGVGPRLTENAKRIRDADAETYEFLPGVHTFLPRPSDHDFRVVIAGRLNAKADSIKNFSMAVECSAKILEDAPSGRGAISLIGAELKDVEEIRARCDVAAGVALNPFAHIADRTAYFARLAENDVLIMPSLKEGFGLVAWEALSLGIPVVVSESSGFYEFIKKEKLLNLITTISIKGKKEDSANLLRAIKSVFDEYPSKSSAALDLRNKLSKYTWESASERFLSCLPGTDAVVGETAIISESTPSQNDEINTLPDVIARRKQGKDLKAFEFSRFEDLLKINYKQRNVLVSTDEGTSFAEGRRVKFELWESPKPVQSFFLFLFPSANISQTISKAIDFLTGKSIRARNITVLRRDKGEKDLIKKLFSGRQYPTDISEYTFKEYIWHFCVDDQFKNMSAVTEITNYIDQSLLSIENEASTQHESAKAFFHAALSEKSRPAAHIIIASGGMGKTSLCLSIVADILADIESGISAVLIQAETLRAYYWEHGYAHLKIESVYDLYEAYSKSLRGVNTQDRLTFELAVLCGNIVVVIDGLDEMLSFFQGQFDLKKFLSSIQTLHSELGTSQIILTTRDGSLIAKDAIVEYNMRCYELLGFDEDNWKTYARRRFQNSPHPEKISRKLFELLAQIQAWDAQGRIVPFFVDIVSNVLEKEFSKNPDLTFDVVLGNTPYPSNNELTDHIVYSVFRREVRRHQIAIDEIELANFVSQAVADFGSSTRIDEIVERLTLLYDSRGSELFDKISLNPLFVNVDGFLKLKYEFLTDYFRGLFLIDSIVSGSSTKEFIRSLARVNATASTEISSVEKYFRTNPSKFHESVKTILFKLKSYSANEDDAKFYETARRATSSILRLYASVRSMAGTRLREQLLDLLTDPSSTSDNAVLDGLYIYGDFPNLDFSDLLVRNCKFVDYKKFTSSRLSDANFLFCIFERCASKQSFNSTVLTAKFDASCDLGDLKDLVRQAAEKGEASNKIVEEDVFKFLSGFFDRGFPFDPKLDWIKFSNRLTNLKRDAFVKLVPEYFVEKRRKASDIYYQLSPGFLDSARKFVTDNYIDAKMQNFFSDVK